MCAVDLMHAVLLGLIKKETDIHLEQDTSSDNYAYALKSKDRETFRKRMKNVEMPSDCGRLPNNILEKTNLDGVSAQQWLLYPLIYTRVCLLNLIPLEAYIHMKLLCEITEIITKHQITHVGILTLKDLLQKHHKLFHKLYGK